jgi:hypothetical protein
MFFFVRFFFESPKGGRSGLLCLTMYASVMGDRTEVFEFCRKIDEANRILPNHRECLAARPLHKSKVAWGGEKYIASVFDGVATVPICMFN